jgi:hypothetical protein
VCQYINFIYFRYFFIFAAKSHQTGNQKMFIGHFGAGFAAKRFDKGPSLGTYFMASQFIDLLWPLFLLFGIEMVEVDPGNTAFTPLNFIYYPFSHSLAGVLVWGFLFGLVYYLLKKNMKAAVIMGILVLSHWLLDLLTHRPDLPLLPGLDVMVGLGLWNSVILTVVIESMIFAAGIYLYMSVTKALNKKGSIWLWSLIGFLVIIYIMNIFSPPPESAEAIGYVGLSQWIIVAWGYYIDKNRVIVN